MLAFSVRGWELVVADMRDDVLAAVATRVSRAVPIGGGRFELEVPTATPPDKLLADLTAMGARLVSLNPVRETLEDFFIERVKQPS
jgi:hypothetical protein